MPAALGKDLILDMQASGACALIFLDGAGYVDFIAIARIGIADERDPDGSCHAVGIGHHLGHGQQADVGIRGFDTLEEAIAESNRLPFGLAGYAFTSSIKNMHLLSKRVEVGMLWINQSATPSSELPFGGVKDSGYGSEGGPEAVEAYLNTKAVSITAA